MASKEPEDSGEQGPDRFEALRQDELIEKLVPDPANPPDLRILAGFLGDSNQEGHVRLYLSPLLDEYIEFSKDDLLHLQRFAPASDPLGGTLVWIRREAKLQHTRTTTGQVQGQFLQGGITTRFLPKAGIEQWSRDQPFPLTTMVCLVLSLNDPCLASIFNLCF